MNVGVFEGSAIALMLTMVATMWGFLQKLISAKLKELHEIIIRLIDRTNRKDEQDLTRHLSTLEKIEMLDKTVAGLAERISFLQGKISAH